MAFLFFLVLALLVIHLLRVGDIGEFRSSVATVWQEWVVGSPAGAAVDYDGPVIEKIRLFDHAGELYLNFTAHNRRVGFFYDLYVDGVVVEEGVVFHNLALPVGSSFAGIMSLSCDALVSTASLNENIELMIDIRANISLSQISRVLMVPEFYLNSVKVTAFEIRDFLSVNTDASNYLWWVNFGADDRPSAVDDIATTARSAAGYNYLIYMEWAH